MAGNAIQIFDGTPTQNVVNEATSNPANGVTFGGAAVFDNTTDLWPLAVATIFITGFGADPSGGSVDLYLMKGNIGTGTEDEDAGGITYGLSLAASTADTQTKGLHYVGSIDLDVDTGNQRRAITFSLAGIKECYFYLHNNTGTSLTQPVTVDIEGFTQTPSV